MSIPFATTTITVARPELTTDELDVTPTPTVGTHVPAVIGGASGNAEVNNGQKTVIQRKLVADMIDLRSTDIVTDDTTGITYAVVWAVQRHGLGLEHAEALLQEVEGAAS